MTFKEELKQNNVNVVILPFYAYDVFTLSENIKQSYPSLEQQIKDYINSVSDPIQNLGLMKNFFTDGMIFSLIVTEDTNDFRIVKNKIDNFFRREYIFAYPSFWRNELLFPLYRKLYQIDGKIT